MKSEPELVRCSITLSCRSHELLRAKEVEPGVYNLEVVEYAKKPRVWAYAVPKAELESHTIKWCEERGIEYEK